MVNDGLTDGRADGLTDGRIDGLTDGRTDGRREKEITVQDGAVSRDVTLHYEED